MNAMFTVLIVYAGTAIGALVAPADRRGAGAAWGFFLGPIGWLIAGSLKPRGVLSDAEREHRELIARRDAAVAARRAEQQNAEPPA